MQPSRSSSSNARRVLVPLALGLFAAASAAQTCPVQWSGVGGGLSHPSLTPSVWTQAVFDEDGPGPIPPALYVGGTFAGAGGVAASNIARWDGSSWSALGAGVNGQVEALCVYDEDGPGPQPRSLYVGGGFTQAGGVSVSNLARWDGSTWSDVGGGVAGLFGGSVTALAVHDDDGPGPTLPALYVGGSFFSAGTAGVTALNIARWDGSQFSDMDLGLDNGVLDIRSYSEGGAPMLFASGYFTKEVSGGLPAAMVARWDGFLWTQVGAGLTGDGFVPHVGDLEVFDDGSGPALYAAGTITMAEGNPAQRIARWNGSTWSQVGAGLSGAEAISLAIWDDGSGQGLYAGGAFNASGATAVDNVARWDGGAWTPVGLGNGTNNTVLTLVTYNDGTGVGLHAGGVFKQAGVVAVQSLARAAAVGSPTIYCTPKVNSQGCTPLLATSGFASAGSSAPFLISASGLINQQSGLLFYTAAGQAAIPFAGGTLCLQVPFRRTPMQPTGGSPSGTDCSGALAFDFNAFLQSGAIPALVPGVVVQAQYWSTDPGFSPPFDVSLTHGVEFAICP